MQNVQKNVQHCYLLDTHVLIWLLTQPERLSNRAKEAILARDSSLYFSMVSLWEMAIKISLGKLELMPGWQDVFKAELQANHIYPVAIDWEAVQLIQSLPFHHRDPFDRMLIAQALSQGFGFISADQHSQAYLPVLW